MAMKRAGQARIRFLETTAYIGDTNGGRKGRKEGRGQLELALSHLLWEAQKNSQAAPDATMPAVAIGSALGVQKRSPRSMWKGTWTAEDRGSEEFWTRTKGRNRVSSSFFCPSYIYISVSEATHQRLNVDGHFLGRRRRRMWLGGKRRKGEMDSRKKEECLATSPSLISSSTAMVFSQAYQDETDVFTRPTEEQIR